MGRTMYKVVYVNICSHAKHICSTPAVMCSSRVQLLQQSSSIAEVAFNHVSNPSAGIPQGPTHGCIPRDDSLEPRVSPSNQDRSLSVSERFFWWGRGALKGSSGTVHYHKTSSTGRK